MCLILLVVFVNEEYLNLNLFEFFIWLDDCLVVWVEFEGRKGVFIEG